MGKITTIVLQPDANVSAILKMTEQNLISQGYNVNTVIINPANASMKVSKDRDGIKDIAGLGVECKVNICILGGNQLTANIESEWTNKIIAGVVGMYLCWIPVVTAVIGALNQNKLPDEISTVLQMAAASNGQGYVPRGGYAPYAGGYQQPYGAPQQNYAPEQTPSDDSTDAQ